MLNKMFINNFIGLTCHH